MPRNAPYGAGATEPAPRTPRLLDQVRQRLRFLHYSIRTERAYADWIKRYILFHPKRHPRELGAAEVESFLTHLAVDRNVPASTQNQAMAAILFLYREVLAGSALWTCWSVAVAEDLLSAPMHELGITQGIIELVAERAAGARVNVVRLEIGKLSAIMPDAIRFCFDLCAQDTALDGAQLEIIEIPGRGRCRQCGGELAMEDFLARCECGSIDIQCVAGEQLKIKEMEVA